jgi:glutaminyl-peptide cyclotransferase
MFYRLLGASLFVFFGYGLSEAVPQSNNYEKILWGYLEKVYSFGPRYSGSEGHQKLQNFLVNEGNRLADSTRSQSFFHRPKGGLPVPMNNIEFRFEGKIKGQKPILLGGHYDTRPFADEEEDPKKAVKPILGANDGGSGTALLLGLAHYFAKNKPYRPIHIVFFDGEDYGEKGSKHYFLGSKYYAKNLRKGNSDWPTWVAVFDMVADKNLEIYRENYSMKSASWLVDEIFNASRKVEGGDRFINEKRFSILDDHYPFILRNIPSVLIIDIIYPDWHKESDTLDKCSSKSLYTVFKVFVETLNTLERFR